MKRWIKNIWDSTVIPADDRDEFVPLEDDPVGALLERQRAAMSGDEMNPTTVEDGPVHTLSQQEPELLPEDGDRLVTREKDPLQTLAEERVLATGVDREEGTIPVENPTLTASPEQKRTSTGVENPIPVEGKSGAAVFPHETETGEDVIESTEEVTVMTTTEPQKQETVQENIADSEPTLPESTQSAPDEPVSDQVEVEPEQAVNSEDATEDGDSDSLLDIFREEEKESNSIFSHGIEDVSIDSLLDEANQVFNKINAKGNKK